MRCWWTSGARRSALRGGCRSCGGGRWARARPSRRRRWRPPSAAGLYGQGSRGRRAERNSVELKLPTRKGWCSCGAWEPEAAGGPEAGLGRVREGLKTMNVFLHWPLGMVVNWWVSLLLPQTADYVLRPRTAGCATPTGSRWRSWAPPLPGCPRSALGPRSSSWTTRRVGSGMRNGVRTRTRSRREWAGSHGVIATFAGGCTSLCQGRVSGSGACGPAPLHAAMLCGVRWWPGTQ